jgi:hypothetical protein
VPAGGRQVVGVEDDVVVRKDEAIAAQAGEGRLYRDLQPAGGGGAVEEVRPGGADVGEGIGVVHHVGRPRACHRLGHVRRRTLATSDRPHVVQAVERGDHVRRPISRHHDHSAAQPPHESESKTP